MSSKNPIVSRPESFGSLYNLLAEKFPNHRTTAGGFNVLQLARDLNRSHETMYRALRGSPDEGFPEGILKVGVALDLLRFSKKSRPKKDRLTWEDLLEYVLPYYHDFSDAEPEDYEYDDLLS